MFRSTTIIRELVLSLAKVMLEYLCPYRLCGGVAGCLGSGVCVVCCAQHTTHIVPSLSAHFA
jgi:fatty-acid desaturase